MAHRGRQSADDALLTALAGGCTILEAAGHAGVSPRTVHRRLADAAFRDQVAEARAAMVERAVARLADAATAAVDTLVDLLTSAPPATRLGAARAVLEIGGKLREQGELEERVQRLEAALEMSGRTGRWA